MDQTAIKESAAELNNLLVRYSATDSDAVRLLGALTPLIHRAESGQIEQALPRSDIPGAYFFQERNLQQYRDLSQSYAKFCLELTGGETPFLRKLREEMGEIDNGNSVPKKPES